MLSIDISIICSIVRLGMMNLPSLKQKIQYSFVVEPSTIVDSMVEEINACCMETTESFAMQMLRPSFKIQTLRWEALRV